jgi:hypothetical protein
MGYLNKTCTEGTTTSSSYGPTAGPVLRGAADTRWAQWTFTAAGQSPAGDDLFTIKTSYPGGRGKPR